MGPGRMGPHTARARASPRRELPGDVRLPDFRLQRHAAAGWEGPAAVRAQGEAPVVRREVAPKVGVACWQRQRVGRRRREPEAQQVALARRAGVGGVGGVLGQRKGARGGAGCRGSQASDAGG
jgi:hypothetical protein